MARTILLPQFAYVQKDRERRVTNLAEAMLFHWKLSPLSVELLRLSIGSILWGFPRLHVHNPWAESARKESFIADPWRSTITLNVFPCLWSLNAGLNGFRIFKSLLASPQCNIHNDWLLCKCRPIAQQSLICISLYRKQHDVDCNNESHRNFIAVPNFFKTWLKNRSLRNTVKVILCPMLEDIRNSIFWFEGFHAFRIVLLIRVVRRRRVWSVGGLILRRGRRNYSKQNLSQYYFFHRTPHRTCPRFEPRTTL
jgi:hypothetical protein